MLKKENKITRNTTSLGLVGLNLILERWKRCTIKGERKGRKEIQIRIFSKAQVLSGLFLSIRIKYLLSSSYDGQLSERVERKEKTLAMLIVGICSLVEETWGFHGGSVVKNTPAKGGDTGLISGLGKSSGGGNDDLLHYSCLGNPRQRSPAGYSPWGHKRV